ncbi:hypothetical protein AMATHDRAFT_75468 [Amanita thiersii Skay4041]|uniref:TOG domain-containing protein n=1 Tax=Amanita thiersii Skay4041 TaxID=703135 RepID=A0A2A9NI56_9AGAR|nr:hypothetical protein AMATHDRAFT_75468 [Amanita thiersii Skay4041]
MVAQRPSYIPLPPPQFSLPDPDHDQLSPCLQFHTAPSTPDLPSPNQIFYTPPTSPLPDALLSPRDLHDFTPQLHDQSSDHCPSPPVDLAIDLALNDEGLSTLERIYLFSRSKTLFHRVFIAHALPAFLDEITPQEANEYVLPLLTGLAMDDEEQVKEALAAELVHIIWWFFTHCQVIPEDSVEEGPAYQDAPDLTVVTISVQAFTPILGTLLLSSNPHVCGAARYAVVDLLTRMRRADDKDARVSSEDYHLASDTFDDDDTELTTGLFGPRERALFQDEILQQVVIGMGRLDIDADYGSGYSDSLTQWNGDLSAATDTSISTNHNHVIQMTEFAPPKDVINPYFPLVLLPSPDSSPASSSSTPDSSNSHSSTGSPEAPATSDSPNGKDVSFSPDAFSNHIDVLLSSNYGSSIGPPSDDCFSSPSLSKYSTRKSSDGVSSPPASAVLSPIQMALNPPKSGRLSPDLIEPSPPPGALADRTLVDMDYDSPHDRVFGTYWNCQYEEDIQECAEVEDEKAAVGRLSSMSLMAAVTASGYLGEETKHAFVKEVERVGRDPVPWVRTEASFALGALAKVVPEELVQCSLLPLFDQLRTDPAWRVRHSAVFALPAILTRLHPLERRMLALETIGNLAMDENGTVRLGVLEVLGEVLYTFHDDQEGAPDYLLDLFLGKNTVRKNGQSTPQREQLLELFIQEPKRPLICAFNYPAVALALGKERWRDLRSLYLSLAQNPEFKVHRTLTASLGELAKIIGEQYAYEDLVGVWWSAIRSEEEEIRFKALEVLETFSAALDRQAGYTIIKGVLAVWEEGCLKSWRERDCVAKSLVYLTRWASADIPDVIQQLLQKSLEDNVAAVRESAALVIDDDLKYPKIWKDFGKHPTKLIELRAYLQTLAHAPTYRKRMTFVACQQALFGHDHSAQIIFDLEQDTLNSIEKLANDTVEGVRIGVARLVGIVCERLMQRGLPITGALLTLAAQMSQDKSHDVQSFIPKLFSMPQRSSPQASSKKRISTVQTFSRPPPLHANQHSDMWRQEDGNGLIGVDARCDTQRTEAAGKQ